VVEQCLTAKILMLWPQIELLTVFCCRLLRKCTLIPVIRAAPTVMLKVGDLCVMCWARCRVIFVPICSNFVQKLICITVL